MNKNFYLQISEIDEPITGISRDLRPSESCRVLSKVKILTNSSLDNEVLFPLVKILTRFYLSTWA